MEVYRRFCSTKRISNVGRVSVDMNENFVISINVFESTENFKTQISEVG